VYQNSTDGMYHFTSAANIAILRDPQDVIAMVINSMSCFTVVKHNACDASASQRKRTS